MGELTAAQWQTALIVFLAVCAGIVLIGNTIKTLKEWRAPKMDVERCLQNDNERLKDLEARSKERDKEFSLILRSQMVMLQHMVTGDHVEDLKKIQDEINQFLIER